ncbi:unnamed protein product [Somion occarium]|uniref:Uncharacterized protein n=1 Tax=Somion occarium TaxID=3059160 RepID=A0ABP1E923_9APHY
MPSGSAIISSTSDSPQISPSMSSSTMPSTTIVSLSTDSPNRTSEGTASSSSLAPTFSAQTCPTTSSEVSAVLTHNNETPALSLHSNSSTLLTKKPHVIDSDRTRSTSGTCKSPGQHTHMELGTTRTSVSIPPEASPSLDVQERISSGSLASLTSTTKRKFKNPLDDIQHKRQETERAALARSIPTSVDIESYRTSQTTSAPTTMMHSQATSTNQYGRSDLASPILRGTSSTGTSWRNRRTSGSQQLNSMRSGGTLIKPNERNSKHANAS